MLAARTTRSRSSICTATQEPNDHVKLPTTRAHQTRAQVITHNVSKNHCDSLFCKCQTWTVAHLLPAAGAGSTVLIVDALVAVIRAYVTSFVSEETQKPLFYMDEKQQDIFPLRSSLQQMELPAKTDLRPPPPDLGPNPQAFRPMTADALVYQWVLPGLDNFDDMSGTTLRGRVIKTPRRWELRPSGSDK